MITLYCGINLEEVKRMSCIFASQENVLYRPFVLCSVFKYLLNHFRRGLVPKDNTSECGTSDIENLIFFFPQVFPVFAQVNLILTPSF
jgi:hypothetical protein